MLDPLSLFFGVAIGVAVTTTLTQVAMLKFQARNAKETRLNTELIMEALDIDQIEENTEDE